MNMMYGKVLDAFERLGKHTKTLIICGLVIAAALIVIATAAKALDIWPMGDPHYTDWFTKTAMSVFSVSVIFPLFGEYVLGNR